MKITNIQLRKMIKEELNHIKENRAAGLERQILDVLNGYTAAGTLDMELAAQIARDIASYLDQSGMPPEQRQ